MIPQQQKPKPPPGRSAIGALFGHLGTASSLALFTTVGSVAWLGGFVVFFVIGIVTPHHKLIASSYAIINTACSLALAVVVLSQLLSLFEPLDSLVYTDPLFAWTRLLFVALTCIGNGLLLWTKAIVQGISGSTFYTGADDFKLFVSGPFSVVRYPLLTFTLWTEACVAILSCHWLALILVAISLGVALIRVREEDALAGKTFAASYYLRYKKRTPALMLEIQL
eukprot:c47360_g1_i1.p1 GENE.c47360_g1_i1~~c47360_g1_i1.p1  ORF type:complete len:241 (-),score=31.72 c47360_g1_i1:177-848(-)